VVNRTINVKNPSYEIPLLYTLYQNDKGGKIMAQTHKLASSGLKYGPINTINHI
jgi:hypothetical protein